MCNCDHVTLINHSDSDFVTVTVTVTVTETLVSDCESDRDGDSDSDWISSCLALWCVAAVVGVDLAAVWLCGVLQLSWELTQQLSGSVVCCSCRGS